MSPELNSATLTSPPDATRTADGEPPPPAPPAGPLDPPPGFTLEREIGSGGMGVVYLARQQGLNRTVALKTVRPGTTLDQRALIRFLAEAEAVAAVRHPNVVEVYAFGEHGGRPYLALEYCPGGDLTTVSKADQTRDANWFRRVAELLARIADGVNAAHALGIVHRDLKPHNGLLTADGTPKVTDFGLAKKGLGTDLTRTTDALGTPAYMAPEQASGRTKFVGPEADVWALGVMLYELLSGTRPFDAPSPLEVMAAVAKADAPKLRDRSPTVPADLALVAHKCLSPDPRDRYPTAGPLAADLRNWLDGKPVTARPAGVVESAVKWVKRNKRAALTGLGVLLTMATATGVSLGFGIDATEQRKKAEEEKQAAIEAKNDLAKANEKTEQTLARSLVESSFCRQMFTQSYSEEHDTPHWHLTDSRQKTFGLLFLEEATTAALSPWYGSNYHFLTEDLLHAVVGLDSTRRTQADDLIGIRLTDPRSSTQLRGLLAAVAVRSGYQLHNPSVLADAIVAEFLATDSGHRAVQARELAECARIAPDRAEELTALALGEMKGLNKFDQGTAGEAIAALCHQLPPQLARKTAAEAVRILYAGYESANRYDRAVALRGVCKLFVYLPSDQATGYAERAINCFISDVTKYGESTNYTDDICLLLLWSPSERSSEVCRVYCEAVLQELEKYGYEYTSIPTRVVRRTQGWLSSDVTDAYLKRIMAVVQGSLSHAKGNAARRDAARGLASVCSLLPPRSAEELLRDALSKATETWERAELLNGLARFGLVPADVVERTVAAARVADIEINDYSFDVEDIPHALEALCLGLTREELHRCKAFPAVASGLVPPDTLPQPKPLPPQVLVDLLKRPFVVREKQRAVLNALEVTYDRKFKDLWEFVAFAEKEHPELDLLTPPKRPERK